MDNRLEPETRKVKGMRRTIARRMHDSLTTTAQLTLNSTMEISKLVDYKNKLGTSYNDLFIQATATALTRHPHLNATMVDNAINVYSTVNIGLAVALKEGLMVPVIEQVEQKGVEEIAEARKELTEKALAGQLTVEEVTSGTFTISNLGMYPIDSFTPILNPPQVALLGIGRIQELPRVVEGEIKPVPVVNFSLTIDHRAIDGAPAAAFLQELEKILSSPEDL